MPKKKAPGEDNFIFEQIINMPEKIKLDLVDVFN
jgi:hypothetical protein